MAPSIIFISDIFHPLVTPLTTYTYTTGSPSSDTVSATDEERLPPGGFSLRHGFPFWFGRAQKSIVSETSSKKFTQSDEEAQSGKASESHLNSTASIPITENQTLQSSKAQDHSSQKRSASIREVLEYVKYTFEDETSLDALPLEAAGNPGAWNAWRSHRKKVLHNQTSSSILSPTFNSRDGGRILAGETMRDHPSHQEGWSWEGVWEERVQRGVQSSISDAVLYGNTDKSDTLVCFRELCPGSEVLTFLHSDKLRRDQ